MHTDAVGGSYSFCTVTEEVVLPCSSLHRETSRHDEPQFSLKVSFSWQHATVSSRSVCDPHCVLAWPFWRMCTITTKVGGLRTVLQRTSQVLPPWYRCSPKNCGGKHARLDFLLLPCKSASLAGQNNADPQNGRRRFSRRHPLEPLQVLLIISYSLTKLLLPLQSTPKLMSRIADLPRVKHKSNGDVA